MLDSNKEINMLSISGRNQSEFLDNAQYALFDYNPTGAPFAHFYVGKAIGTYLITIKNYADHPIDFAISISGYEPTREGEFVGLQPKTIFNLLPGEEIIFDTWGDTPLSFENNRNTNNEIHLSMCIRLGDKIKYIPFSDKIEVNGYSYYRRDFGNAYFQIEANTCRLTESTFTIG